ncbi:MAG: DUF3943 domain-containing protein [Treponema sp.]|nr:DUF3943 domain-containing protein [Treponema sp.]
MKTISFKRRFLILPLILMIGTGSVFAQDSEAEDKDTELVFTMENESEEQTYKRNFLVAGGALIFPNMVIGAWNRFIIKSSWAQVGFDDLTHFYEHKWAWDEDWYWTNFVLHPYQGALTYMGARSANFTPWESILWATASSVIWEYFFETNAPSINDLIYTSVGAFPLGEMLFRLSYSLQNVWSPLRFLANPVRLFTDPTMRGKTNVPKGNVTELSFKFGVGTEIGKTWADSEHESIKEQYPAFLSAFMDIVYGNPYGNDSNIPYSQFELSFGGNIGLPSGYGYKELEEKLMYEVKILSNGMILARSVEGKDNVSTTIGIVLDYDFIWQSFQELSTISPGFAIKQQIEFPASTLSWQFHLDATLLGTTDFYYYRRRQFDDYLSYRSYSYAIGAESVGKIEWKSQNGHKISFDAHSYLMYDMANQTYGEMSSGLEIFSLCQLDYEYRIAKNISLGLSNNVYLKYATYKDLPSIFATMYKGQVYTRVWVR